MREWIDVRDELPDSPRSVEVTIYNTFMNLAYTAYARYEPTQKSWIKQGKGTVTAWRERSVPYQRIPGEK